MYRLEKFIDGTWVPQCKTGNRATIEKELKDYAEDNVVVFKTCDAVRIIEVESQDTILMYPEDFHPIS